MELSEALDVISKGGVYQLTDKDGKPSEVFFKLLQAAQLMSKLPDIIEDSKTRIKGEGTMTCRTTQTFNEGFNAALDQLAAKIKRR